MSAAASARAAVALAITGLGQPGCDAGGPPAAQAGGPPFASVFATDSIILEEAAGDSIGEIRSALELASGDLVVVERFRPRLHLYDPAGRLKASAGSAGSGPGELRVIAGAAEGPDGDVYLVDSRLGRITVLDGGDLSFERVMEPPVPPLGPIAFHGDRMLLASLGSRTGDRFHMVEAGEVRWSASPMPAVIHDRPYWINFALHGVAKVGGHFVVGSGILYPLERIGPAGDIVAFGRPPPSFRRIPVVAPGAFPQGPRGAAFEAFLASFDVVGGLYPLGDDHLAVVHSTYEPHPRMMALRTDRRLDLYRLSDTTKVAEDVALPRGSTVVAGGRALYIVVSRPPAPWRLLRARPRP